jgi:chromosome segregation ATPase
MNTINHTRIKMAKKEQPKEHVADDAQQADAESLELVVAKHPPASDEEARGQLVLEYPVALARLEEMKSACTDLIANPKANYLLIKSNISKLVKARVAVENRRVELKADILKQGKMIDGVAKEITALITSIEEPLKGAKKLVDDEQERIKREREEAERLEREKRKQEEAAQREREEAERRKKEEARRKKLKPDIDRIRALSKLIDDTAGPKVAEIADDNLRTEVLDAMAVLLRELGRIAL